MFKNIYRQEWVCHHDRNAVQSSSACAHDTHVHSQMFMTAAEAERAVTALVSLTVDEVSCKPASPAMAVMLQTPAQQTVPPSQSRSLAQWH